MLIYSMSVSVDGFIADREGAFGWGAPSEELFRFHTASVSELGGFLCGRRLYETMLVWETDPPLRGDEPGAAFADVWCGITKVVFSHTLDSVEGNARLAEASLPEEAAAALDRFCDEWNRGTEADARFEKEYLLAVGTRR